MMSTQSDNASASFGEKLALVVGITLLAAAVVVLVVGPPVLATILVLIGAGALSGWVKARKSGEGASRR